jgi:Family of unknown function (DUF5761)
MSKGMMVEPSATVPETRHSSEQSLRGRVDSTAVSEVFFSQTNVDALHESIRYLVYKYSSCRHIIDRQSDEELQLIMRGTYFDHAKNYDFNVLEQVRELNALVLDFCVPRILREINMFVKYQQEVLRNPQPIVRPEYLSTSGKKTFSLSRT